MTRSKKRYINKAFSACRPAGTLQEKNMILRPWKNIVGHSDVWSIWYVAPDSYTDNNLQYSKQLAVIGIV